MKDTRFGSLSNSLMHSVVTMQIWQSKRNVVPMWGGVGGWVTWMAVHTDVVHRVRSAKPAGPAA